jgi:hypothetical protein
MFHDVRLAVPSAALDLRQLTPIPLMRICFRLACVAAALATVPVHAQSGASAQMSFAAAEGDLRAVTRVLDAGFAVNTRWAPNDHFALLKAAEWGHVEVVRFLLSRGADPKLKDNAGRTARWWAVNNDHREVARILTEAEGVPADVGRRVAAPAGPVRPAEPVRPVEPARPAEPVRPVPRVDAGPELPPAGATPRDGLWRGTIAGITTGGGQTVSFRVARGRVVETDFHVDHHCKPSYAYRERLRWGFQQPITITNGAFARLEKVPNVDLEVTGRFATALSADGTFKEEDTSGCTTRRARWSARWVGR